MKVFVKKPEFQMKLCYEFGNGLNLCHLFIGITAMTVCTCN